MRVRGHFLRSGEKWVEKWGEVGKKWVKKWVKRLVSGIITKKKWEKWVKVQNFWLKQVKPKAQTQKNRKFLRCGFV